MINSAEDLLNADKNGGDTLAIYAARLAELVRPTDELIPLAAKLAETEEWKAFREILMMNIANQEERWMLSGTPPTSVEWGNISGRRSVIQMVEKEILVAEELRKKGLESKVEKKNDTTA